MSLVSISHPEERSTKWGVFQGACLKMLVRWVKEGWRSVRKSAMDGKQGEAGFTRGRVRVRAEVQWNWYLKQRLIALLTLRKKILKQKKKHVRKNIFELSERRNEKLFHE